MFENLIAYFTSLGYSPQEATQYAASLVGPAGLKHVSQPQPQAQLDLGPAEVTPIQRGNLDMEVESVRPAHTRSDYDGEVGAGRVLNAFGFSPQDASKAVGQMVMEREMTPHLKLFLMDRYGMDEASATMYAKKLAGDDPAGEYRSQRLQPAESTRNNPALRFPSEDMYGTLPNTEYPFDAAWLWDRVSTPSQPDFTQRASNVSAQIQNDFQKWLDMQPKGK